MMPIVGRKVGSQKQIVACLVVIAAIFVIQVAGCNNNRQLHQETYKIEPPVADKPSSSATDWSFYGPLRKQYQIEDKLISGLIGIPPRSAWIESEKAFYKKLLKAKKYDVLVVPFQTQSYGVDHVARILMSYQLAVEIEKSTNLRIAPLSVVYPALGSLQRYYDENEVLSFAREIGVSRIIWGFAGTENEPGDTKISLCFSIIDEVHPFSDADRKIKCKKWKNIFMQPDRLPYQELDAHLEEVMAFLNLPFERTALKVLSDQSVDFKVPISPAELLAAPADDVLARSHYLQFLAMLAPTDYQKTYLFTLSISNLFQLKTTCTDRKLIEARALLHLYRRPAAIMALEGLNCAEADALREFANANLPELEAKVNALKPSLKRVLAELELFYLKDAYDQKMTEAEIDAYTEKYPGWAFFLRKRLAHYGQWERSSNVELVHMLNKYLPVPGFSSDFLLANQAIAAGEDAPIKPELLFQDYIHKAIVKLKEMPSNTTNMAGNNLDLGLLIMAESFGQHNLMQMIEILGFTQYLPGKGLQLCDEILKTYKEHPYFTTMKFTLLYNQIEGSSPEVQKNIKLEVCDLSVKTLWWNGRQNWVNSSARLFLSYLSKPGEEAIEPLNPFISKSDLMKAIGMDYPFRVNNVQYENLRPMELLVPWVQTEIEPIIRLYREYSFPRAGILPEKTSIDKDDNKAPYILSEIQNRFNGHPEKTKFMISQKTTGNQAKDKKVLLSTQIEKGSRDWNTYKELATLYIMDNSYDTAKSIFLKYPGFKPPFEPSIIGTSNVAAAAGNLFLAHGAVDHAMHFYEISSKLDTGSASCYEAQERLSLLEKKFVAATEYSLIRAQRYNDPSAYANYLTYLHLQGKHSLAWSMFQNLITRYSESPELWDAAFIGHRIEGKSDDEIISWMQTLSQSITGDRQRSYLARFGILCLIDREPNQSMIAAIQKYDSRTLLKFHKFKVLPPENGPLVFSSYAQSYAYLLNNEYKEAYNSLSRNTIFRPEGYYVYAGIKAGDMERIRKYYYPDTWVPKANAYQDFGKFVAHAVTACYSTNHEKALSFLEKAFSLNPPIIDEPYFTMQYLFQITEWLYQDSKDERYATLLLKWARIYQLTYPVWVWPYAIEANYANDPKVRLRALAFAQYLDSRSTRLKPFGKELKQKGSQWFRSNNPFSSNAPDNKKI